MWNVLVGMITTSEHRETKARYMNKAMNKGRTLRLKQHVKLVLKISGKERGKEPCYLVLYSFFLLVSS